MNADFVYDDDRDFVHLYVLCSPHSSGKERDTESGNDYFGARYYASSMGRFLSPDPSGLMYADPTNPQSLNLYSYAYNNPLINIDPSGMECVWDDGSYDASDDPQTGNAAGCSSQGGTYVDPSMFESVEGNQAGSWSGQASSSVAFDWTTPSSITNAGPWDLSTFLAYGSLWAAGQLPTQLNYGPNDPATLAMINRPYIQNQLAAYKAAGCPATGTKAGQGSGAAYKETAGDVASGNPNYVQAEVGGYSGSITTSGGVTTVTISNVSGISSFVGYSAAVGAINSATGSHFNRNALDTTSGPGRNVTQTFTQTMPSPCGGG
jgi:RHS repeat-associated protein